MIIKCTCKNEMQDKLHGVFMRVHTPTVKEPKGQHWRCTVCRTEHTKSGGGEDGKKKGKGK